MDTARHVAAFRKAAAATRRLAMHGGNTMATTNALRRHEIVRNDACRALTAAGHRDIIGWLTQEDTLHRNIAQRRANNATYPELTERLRAVRAQIRSKVGA